MCGGCKFVLECEARTQDLMTVGEQRDGEMPRNGYSRHTKYDIHYSTRFRRHFTCMCIQKTAHLIRPSTFSRQYMSTSKNTLPFTCLRQFTSLRPLAYLKPIHGMRLTLTDETSHKFKTFHTHRGFACQTRSTGVKPYTCLCEWHFLLCDYQASSLITPSSSLFLSVPSLRHKNIASFVS